MIGRPLPRRRHAPARRNLLVAAISAAALAPGMSAAAPALTIYKTESCGCCKGWIVTMTRAGYAPKVVVLTEVATVGEKLAVPFALSSCHLSTIGGYVVVGHVPPVDVARLLRERPKALGLAVPGIRSDHRAWSSRMAAGSHTTPCFCSQAGGPGCSLGMFEREPANPVESGFLDQPPFRQSPLDRRPAEYPE